MDLFMSLVVGVVIAAIAGAITYQFFELPEERKARYAALSGLAIGAMVFFIVWSNESDGSWAKLHDTLRAIGIAVLASAAVFIGANKLFDLAPKRWRIYTTVLGSGAALFVFALLWGNKIVFDTETRGFFPEFLLGLIVAGALGGVVGWIQADISARATRVAVTAGGGAIFGLLSALLMNETATVAKPRQDPSIVGLFPDIDYMWLILWTLIGIGIGFGIWVLRGRSVELIRPVLTWGTFGWLVGAYLASGHGIGADGTALGTRAEAILAATVLGGLIGARLGLIGIPPAKQRDELERRSKIWVFLTPALAFITLSLVIPTIRTIILSFKDARSEEVIGAANYSSIFTDPTIFKVDEWASIFSSRLFWAGLILLVVGVVVGRIVGRQTGRNFEFSGGSGPPIAFGIFLLAFAAFSVLRGTIFNNLWWVFTVTILATSLGLAIAVLADRAKMESVAKSIIFLPMAISFVGASIIWRFMYIARPEGDEQTGVLNSIWVGLGSLSNTTTPKYIAVGVLLLLVAGLAFLAYRGWKGGANGVLAGSIVTALPLLWIVYRFLGPGLGGFVERESGEVVADTILFLQESPMNNLWLMVVLIWIQTGFSMVIFSAAIKGVPHDLIEAAKVDGATESQTFWRVIIPQIATTIGVVVTTLIVLVMKVFDIVKVMTNGNFDTQVLANEMWQRAFTEFDFGLGSAVAVVLFLSVLPVMYINIRRMQKAAA
jgi:alpha-glucoside transport system permease protein